MASAGGIRAGKAYVELGTKDTGLVKGLTKAQARLQSFQGTVGKIGTALGALALGVGFKQMVGHFADTGSSLVEMSKRTGIAIETLSQLRHAAAMSGTNLEDIERAMKRMAVGLVDASRGGKAAAASFDILGLNAATLLAMSPTDQFFAIGEAIDRIEDPTLRAAAAIDIFGKSGTDMFPLFAEGSEKIKKAMAEAIVVTRAEAEEAEQLGDVIDTLSSSLKAAAFQAVSAFAPALKWIAERTSETVAQIATAIRDLKGLPGPNGGIVDTSASPFDRAAEQFRRTGRNPVIATSDLEAYRDVILKQLKEEQARFSELQRELAEAGNMTVLEAVFGGLGKLRRLSEELDDLHNRVETLNHQRFLLNQKIDGQKGKETNLAFDLGVRGIDLGKILSDVSQSGADVVKPVTSAITSVTAATQGWGAALAGVGKEWDKFIAMKADVDELQKSLEFDVRTFGMTPRQQSLEALREQGANAAQLEKAIKADQVLTKLEGLQAEMEKVGSRQHHLTADALVQGSEAAARAILGNKFGSEGDLAKAAVEAQKKIADKIQILIDQNKQIIKDNKEAPRLAAESLD